MRNRAKYRAIIIFFTLLVTLSLAFPSFAKGVKTKAAKQVTGYCVYHGRIFKATESTCKKQRGIFFKDKGKALVYLDAQTPGYCCLNNEVASMKKGLCLKKKGHFFKKKAEALSCCKANQSGWCCIDGKIVSMKKGDCEKKKGHFFKEKKKASDCCDLHQKGYCCLDGKITETLKDGCLKRKGHFFSKKEAATQYCESHQKGYCLLDGKILSMTKGNCLKKKGRFYKGKNEARKVYEASKQGWCCRKGRIRHLTKGACEKNKGKYFAKKQEASRYLQLLKGRNQSLTRAQMAKVSSGKKAKTIPKPNSHFNNTGSKGGGSKSSEIRVNAPPLPRKKHLTFSSTGPVSTSNGGDSVSTPEGEQPIPVRGQGPNSFTKTSDKILSRSPARHFPARISYIVPPDDVQDHDHPHMSHPGEVIVIVGERFGRNQGRVDILISGLIFHSEIIRWSDERVDCRVPYSVGDAIGSHNSKDTLVWLKPARVEPPHHKTMPGHTDEEPYYYSGDEGPSKDLRIYQLIPYIDDFILDFGIPHEKTITIRGRGFGNSPGTVHLTVMGVRENEHRSYRVGVSASWSNTEIIISISNRREGTEEDLTDWLSSASCRSASFTIINRFGKSATSDWFAWSR